MRSAILGTSRGLTLCRLLHLLSPVVFSLAAVGLWAKVHHDLKDNGENDEFSFDYGWGIGLAACSVVLAFLSMLSSCCLGGSSVDGYTTV